MSLTAALIIDALFGEPDWLWRRLPHPAVLLGRLVGALDDRLNRGGGRRAKGVVALIFLIAVAATAGWIISIMPLSPLAEIIVAAILLAQRSLADHVDAVAKGLEESAEAKAIIRTVIALGQNLGVRILMEGVETEAQRDFLLREGCFDVQGFLYGVPLPSDECDFEPGDSEHQQSRDTLALGCLRA